MSDIKFPVAVRLNATLGEEDADTVLYMVDATGQEVDIEDAAQLINDQHAAIMDFMARGVDAALEKLGYKKVDPDWLANGKRSP